MLAIRLKRTGRKGHAQFRVVVQDSHFHPSRGRVVAYLGSYNPHTKTTQLDKDTAAKYLGNGAQPSERVAHLLKNEGVELPAWVKLSDPKKRSIRNPEKLRRNRPAEAPVETPVEEPVAEIVAEAESETTAEPEAPAEAEAPTAPEEPAAETSSEQPASDDSAAEPTA